MLHKYCPYPSAYRLYNIESRSQSISTFHKLSSSCSSSCRASPTVSQAKQATHHTGILLYSYRLAAGKRDMGHYFGFYFENHAILLSFVIVAVATVTLVR